MTSWRAKVRVVAMILPDGGRSLDLSSNMHLAQKVPITDRSDGVKPNEGIYQDGFEAAFLHNASPIDNDYGTMTTAPHLHFQRWSWLSGYVDGLRAKIEKDAAR